MGSAQPFVSTLNALNDSIVANAAIVPAGTSGGVSSFVTDATHLIIDSNGWFAPACSYSLNATNFFLNNGSGSSPNSIRVTTTGERCAWKARSNLTWVEITSGPTGIDNGPVGFQFEANRQAFQRSGTLSIAGQVVSMTQMAADCSFGINPASATIGPAGGNGSFQVSTDCEWSVSPSNDWIRITSPVNAPLLVGNSPLAIR